MLKKEYLSNISSKNILDDINKKNLSSSFSSLYTDNIIDNMILNSNLDNDNVIK